jgi:hypothetical protein
MRDGQTASLPPKHQDTKKHEEVPWCVFVSSSLSGRNRFLTTVTGVSLWLVLFSSQAWCKEPITIYLAGDSTMAEKLPEKRPETGWGEALQKLFNPEKVRIENHAKNGRSTRTFIEEKLWLQSRQQCFWKVRIWDQTGKVSSWSNPAQWSMGLMEPADWSARWIGDRLPSVENVAATMLRRIYTLRSQYVAYKLINHHTFPSWGYSIENGATTIWERWDGYVKGRGFQDKGMNSFNHYAIGAVGEWMYRVILGINNDDAHPAYEHFVIRPYPGGALTFAKGSYDSIRGKIESSWNIAAGKLRLDVRIPPTTTATVYVPARDTASVTEGAKPAVRLAV